MRKETKLLLYIFLLSINLPTSANSLIWETDFSSESEFNEWSIYDANEDGNTWNFSVGEEPSVSIEYIKNNPSYKIIQTEIYDLSGTKQRSIKGNLDNSIKLPSGIYIIKEQTSIGTKTKKVILP